MFHKWKQWQEDAALDSKLQEMWYKRKQKKIEIHYHMHYICQQEVLLARMKSEYYKAKEEYEQMDLDMALLDGRLSYIVEEPPTQKSVKKELKEMSKDEIQKLIAELEAMG